MTPELRRHIDTTLLYARYGRYTSPADYTQHVTTLLANVDTLTARCAKLEADNADLRERATACATNAADLASMLTETVDRHADALTVLEERVRRLEEAKTLEVPEPAPSHEG